MRKLIYAAVTAITFMTISCGQKESTKMSPEAIEAWEQFKITAKKVAIFDAAQDIEDFQKAMKDWQNAAENMALYDYEYSKEIADSMNTITTSVANNVQFIIEQQTVADIEEDKVEDDADASKENASKVEETVNKQGEPVNK